MSNVVDANQHGVHRERILTRRQCLGLLTGASLATEVAKAFTRAYRRTRA